MESSSATTRFQENLDSSPPPTSDIPSSIDGLQPDAGFWTSTTEASSSWDLMEGGNGLIIGRADSRVQGPRYLIRNPRVSWVHARILKEDGCFYLEDCGLKYGTLLNDALIIRRHRIKNNDMIGIAIIGTIDAVADVRRHSYMNRVDDHVKIVREIKVRVALGVILLTVAPERRAHSTRRDRSARRTIRSAPL